MILLVEFSKELEYSYFRFQKIVNAIYSNYTSKVRKEVTKCIECY